jgi:hypothetical protein
MSFIRWLKRSFGRTAEGLKAHLIGTAELLGVDPSVTGQMKRSSDEESERLLIDSIQGRHGTVVDWKASLEEILEAFTGFTEEERGVLGNAGPSLASERIYRVSSQITELLAPPMRVLRIVETFGDAYIVFLVPPPLVEEFDRVNKHWSI